MKAVVGTQVRDDDVKSGAGPMWSALGFILRAKQPEYPDRLKICLLRG